MRRKSAVAAAAVVILASSNAWAQAKAATGEGLGALLRLLTDRIDLAFSELPEVWRFFATLGHRFDAREALLLIGVLVAGLAAEWLARQLLIRVRHRIHGHGTKSPLRSLLQVMLLDGLALLALWIAARAVVGQLGEPQSHLSRLGHQLLLGLVYWRGFNFVFRVWLRPSSPSGRLAPVDDLQARRLLRALNVVIVLPMIARTIVHDDADRRRVAGGDRNHGRSLCSVRLGGSGLRRLALAHDMAAWLAGMVSPKDLFRPLKLALAHNWWVGGLVFYVASGLLAVYAAVTGPGGQSRHLDRRIDADPAAAVRDADPSA